MTPPTPVVFVLCHTHWDREWYHPAPRFRKRLVDLIDALLDEPNGQFLLDGQAILLSDYLSVRPDRAAEIAAALRRRRLEAGPWYTQPDELIPSGEALVRNLLAGRRTLRALNAEPPSVLYCADSFGHPSVLPAIAAGFAMPVIVLWRGYGGGRAPKGDATHWSAPNEDTALLFHLSQAGYELGANLPTDGADAQRRWTALRAALESRSTLGVWLVPNGADHHAPQPQRRRAIAALAAAAAPIQLRVGGLDELGKLLADRAAGVSLPRIAGELRDSYGYTWTLAGTLATRAHQKRANACLERDLVRDVEPWCALARLAGGASSRHHLQAAWATLLQCHPHDSLCGCASDAVARAVDQRLADAAALAIELREAALTSLTGHEPDAVRSQPHKWHSTLIVRNRASRERSGVAEVALDVALARVPVGSGSHGRAEPIIANGALRSLTQILTRERLHSRTEAPGHYPINYLIERRRALVWSPAVPPYGLLTLPLGDSAAPEPTSPTPRAHGARRRIASAAGTLKLTPRGVAWLDAATGRSVPTLIGFEIVRDRGDTYTHSPVVTSLGKGVLSRARVSARGPLRAALDTRWRVACRGSAAGRAVVAVNARLMLDAGASFVRVHVHGENRAQDHRLRVLIHTGVRPRRVWADAAFALIERKALRVPARDRRAETPPTTAPLHRFVSIFDGPSGCTVLSDGLAEYEVLPDGVVAVTLVRAVAELSRAELPERPGHAGWPLATPAAQCLGPFAAEFAVAFHGADSLATRAQVAAIADDVLLPLSGYTRHDSVSDPPPVHGVALEGTGLVFAALKESEDGRSIVARCVNVTGKDVPGAWIFPRPVRSAQLARLDESPIGSIEPRGATVPIVVRPHGIHTVLVPVDELDSSR
ncbi:MAG: glycosyl hydrolase-related protein [Gemmatimonadaceae bacterium]